MDVRARARCVMLENVESRRGLEPRIFCSEDRRVVHYATETRPPQDSNLRGQSPVAFEATALTARPDGRD